MWGFQPVREKKIRGKREEREKIREEREEMRGEWVPLSMWTSLQHLIVILTLFDHFNGLSHNIS